MNHHMTPDVVAARLYGATIDASSLVRSLRQADAPEPVVDQARLLARRLENLRSEYVESNPTVRVAWPEPVELCVRADGLIEGDRITLSTGQATAPIVDVRVAWGSVDIVFADGTKWLGEQAHTRFKVERTLPAKAAA